MLIFTVCPEKGEKENSKAYRRKKGLIHMHTFSFAPDSESYRHRVPPVGLQLI